MELAAEVFAEEVVDDCEHFRTRPVVPCQRENVLRAVAPLAEHLDVRVAEPVDRLELVPDVEHGLLAWAGGQEVDQLALQSVRVLELVDHDRPESQLLPLADRGFVAEQVTRAQLQILEVER